MERLKGHILKALGAVALLLSLFACSPDWADEMEIDCSVPSGNPGDRTAMWETRKVMLLYSAGFNSLTPYLTEDIEDLKTGWLPGRNRNDDVVLVYSHFPEASGKYSVPNPPVLARLYQTMDGETVADTLVVYDSSVVSSSPAQLNEVLSYVKDEFPAAGYGMIFSSHATGYLPAGFYQKPGDYIYNKGKARMHTGMSRRGAVAYPYVELPSEPGMPAVKSIGQDQVGTSGNYTSYEMELAEFAEAIPMKLGYLLFDACLMGGIEVAYELRGKVRTVGFSQAEVLAEGLNYSELTAHLLKDDSDPVGVCKDYYEQYDIQEGVYRSATVSTIDCDALEPLAELCNELFDRYRDDIASLSPGKVQRYYRSNYHWFYDLESILVEAGITEGEYERLCDALDACVIYKGHTPSFMNTFEINTFSGFSMYLPSHGHAELDEYYKTLAWNKATGLVE